MLLSRGFGSERNTDGSTSHAAVPVRWSAADWSLLSWFDGRVCRSNCWQLTSWRRVTSNSWRNSWDSPGGSQRSCPSLSRRTGSITSSQLATQARVHWDKKQWRFNYIFWSKYPDLVRFGTFLADSNDILSSLEDSSHFNCEIVESKGNSDGFLYFILMLQL